MRKLLVVAALSAGSLSLGAFGGASADTVPGGVEGCVATTGANSPAGLVYANACSYTATRTGGFVGGAQSWKVTVYNNASPTKVAIGRYSGTGPACNTGSTSPGNLVVVELTNGTIAAGNPFPSAVDGTVPTAGNRCP